MEPINLYCSFDEAVYRRPARIAPHAHISGNTTKVCEPPRFLLEVAVEKWEAIANRLLQSIRASPKADIFQHGKLVQAFSQRVTLLPAQL
jgi:hypothetical protein